MSDIRWFKMDLHGLIMTGFAACDLFVRRIGDRPVRKTGHCLDETTDFLEVGLHLPETAARYSQGLCLRRVT